MLPISFSNNIVSQVPRLVVPQVSGRYISEDRFLEKELLYIGRQYVNNEAFRDVKKRELRTSALEIQTRVININAYEFFIAAQKNGNAEAMYEIGLCYEKGRGVSKNYDQAIAWYDKSYAAGHQPALLKATNLRMFQLADNAFQGIGRQKDLRQAACTFLSVDPQVLPEVVQKLEACCQEMIQAKDWKGLAMVADYYYEGVGREVDFAKAASLYAQCDLTNFPKALFQLLDCYEKMARQGDVMAMYNLGVLLERQKDTTVAAFWFQKAAEKGHFGALYAWATYLEKGVATEANPEQAIDLYKQAARQGCCKDSAYRLWHIYQSKQDEQSAQEYLHLAALWGHAEARQIQALRYRMGAEAGNKESMYNWAICLENAIGTAADPEQAIAWYKQAAERGCLLSVNRLCAIYQYRRDWPSFQFCIDLGSYWVNRNQPI